MSTDMVQTLGLDNADYRRKLLQSHREAKQVGRLLDDELNHLGSSATRVRSPIQSIDRGMNKTRRTTDRAAGSVNRLAGGLGSLVTGAVAFGAVAAGVAAILRTIDETDQKFGSINSTVRQSKREFAELTDSTGLSLTRLFDGSTKAAMGFAGAVRDHVIPTLDFAWRLPGEFASGQGSPVEIADRILEKNRLQRLEHEQRRNAIFQPVIGEAMIERERQEAIAANDPRRAAEIGRRLERRRGLQAINTELGELLDQGAPRGLAQRIADERRAALEARLEGERQAEDRLRTKETRRLELESRLGVARDPRERFEIERELAFGQLEDRQKLLGINGFNAEQQRLEVSDRLERDMRIQLNAMNEQRRAARETWEIETERLRIQKLERDGAVGLAREARIRLEYRERLSRLERADGLTDEQRATFRAALVSSREDALGSAGGGVSRNVSLGSGQGALASLVFGANRTAVAASQVGGGVGGADPAVRIAGDVRRIADALATGETASRLAVLGTV